MLNKPKTIQKLMESFSTQQGFDYGTMLKDAQLDQYAKALLSAMTITANNQYEQLLKDRAVRIIETLAYHRFSVKGDTRYDNDIDVVNVDTSNAPLGLVNIHWTDLSMMWSSAYGDYTVTVPCAWFEVQEEELDEVVLDWINNEKNSNLATLRRQVAELDYQIMQQKRVVDREENTLLHLHNEASKARDEIAKLEKMIANEQSAASTD